MREAQIAPLIHTRTAAIQALEAQLSVHEAIRRVLRTVAVGALTCELAIKVLEEMEERGDSPEQASIYRQTIAELHRLQSEPL